MKIVVTAAGSRGDVQPMLLLARTLRDRGHTVRFCGPANFRAWAEQMGLDYTTGSQDVQASFAEARDIAASPYRFLQRGLKLVGREVALQFDALERQTEGADLLVSGGVVFAARSIAAWRGMPSVGVAYAPTLMYSPANTPPFFPWNDLPVWMNRALWLLIDGMLWASMGRLFNARRRALGLGPVYRLFPHFAEGPILLAADPELSVLPPDLAARTGMTGAFTQEADPTLPAEIEAFLQEGPPPVYIGFGSMPQANAEKLQAMIGDALVTAGVRGILHSGWADLRGDRARGCLTVGSVSHAALFPRMAALIHHGGAGTSAAACRSGVPQILIPHIADQFYFSERLRRLGVCAEVLPRMTLSADRLASAIQRTVGDTALATRAAAVGRQMADRQGLDAAATWIEALVP